MSAVPASPLPKASLCHTQTGFAPDVQMIEKEFGKDVCMKKPVPLPAQQMPRGIWVFGRWLLLNRAVMKHLKDKSLVFLKSVNINAMLHRAKHTEMGKLQNFLKLKTEKRMNKITWRFERWKIGVIHSASHLYKSYLLSPRKVSLGCVSTSGSVS